MYKPLFKDFIEIFKCSISGEKAKILEKDSFVYVVCTDKVLVGKMQNAEINFYEEFDLKNMREVRIFNKDGEFKAVYSSAKKAFLCREIYDDENSAAPHFINKHFVFGEEVVDCRGGFTIVKQDGKEFVYPFEVNQKKFLVQLINYDYYEFYDNNTNDNNKNDNVMYLKDNRMVDFVEYREEDNEQ